MGRPTRTTRRTHSEIGKFGPEKSTTRLEGFQVKVVATKSVSQEFESSHLQGLFATGPHQTLPDRAEQGERARERERLTIQTWPGNLTIRLHSRVNGLELPWRKPLLPVFGVGALFCL